MQIVAYSGLACTIEHIGARAHGVVESICVRSLLVRDRQGGASDNHVCQDTMVGPNRRYARHSL